MDIIAFLQYKPFPVDEYEALNIAENLMVKPPQGDLPISNTRQLRLQKPAK